MADHEHDTAEPSVAMPPAPPALGPGDDDPRSPARETAGPATPAAGPGDAVGPSDAGQMIAPLPAGPGDAAIGPRFLARLPGRVAARDDEGE